MESSQSLTELCAVCYTEQPKYKCPRCKTQTCSVPCYKKHQQRASCTGQRDPSAFLKKSQWATPAGIDHDYNYLKSVERQIDSAGEHIKARTGTDGSKRHNHRQWQGEGNLQTYLQQTDITIVRAPAGMSRSKTNKTRVTGRGNVFWTVEWLDEQGLLETVDDSSATATLTELYNAVIARRAKLQRQRKQESDEPAAKRRRLQQSMTDIEDGSITTQHESVDEATPVAAVQIAKHFYLHKPGNGAEPKVLIALDAQHTLTQALSGRSVQEYPTIVALPYPPTELPDAYVTEAAFLEKREQSAKSTKQLDLPSKEDTAPPPTLDAAQIIEMLRRDVRTR